MNTNQENFNNGEYGFEMTHNGFYRNLDGLMTRLHEGNEISVEDIQNPPRLPNHDTALARRLLRLFNEAFSGIAEILYKSIMVEPLYSGVSDVLDVISTENLDAMRLLGRLILDMGENPRIISNIRTAQINYTPLTGISPAQLMRIINDTLETENSFIRNYNDILSVTTDPVVADVLTGIIEIHESHIAPLNRLLIS